MTVRQPRGIRNNNPGNIENNGIPWNGLSSEQTDSRFYQFVSPEYGIRAMARILNNYQVKHGLNTVRALINRWAPPFENKTDSYAEHVAHAAGLDPDQPIDVSQHLADIIPVMIKHENGQQPYSQSTINTGIQMAFA
ncbi:structural protein [Litoribrevibacter euphylliae]|uniref:Structural protein n=2 Tax=Litoribrevibacter euphylliae TaxID=1834034 RepID=A0ABV7HD34_9GAMM